MHICIYITLFILKYFKVNNISHNRDIFQSEGIAGRESNLPRVTRPLSGVSGLEARSLPEQSLDLCPSLHCFWSWGYLGDGPNPTHSRIGRVPGCLGLGRCSVLIWDSVLGAQLLVALGQIPPQQLSQS